MRLVNTKLKQLVVIKCIEMCERSAVVPFLQASVSVYYCRKLPKNQRIRIWNSRKDV